MARKGASTSGKDKGDNGGGESNQTETPKTKTEFIKLIKEPDDEKIAPQMRGICAALKALGAAKKEVTYEDLCGGDSPNLLEHVETKQSAGRIYGFYRSKLVSGGYITSEKREG